MEAPKILIDHETGVEQVEFDKDGEKSEVFLRTPEGEVLYYANIKEISKYEADKRIFELMDIEISPAIMELMGQNNTKLYIKFSEGQENE